MTDWRITLSEIDFDQAEREAVDKVISSGWLTMAEVTQSFERKFAEYCGVRYAFAVANGTAALHLAHRILGIGEGDEVICPSLSFIATANAALYCGAIPIFADVISPDNLTIAPKSIEANITPKTRCIVVMHYGGQACDMDRISEIGAHFQLPIVEDACHAVGAEWYGQKCGSLADIACFSFFSNKNMVTGEGGMITTDNPLFAEKIRKLRCHGMTSMTWDRHSGHHFGYDVDDLGYNYRIDEIRSALGIVQLQKLDANNEKRKNLVARYRENLRRHPEIGVPLGGNESRNAFHLFPILLPERGLRDPFMRAMARAGIQTSIHYTPIHQLSYYKKHIGNRKTSLPMTEFVGQRLVTLPLHPRMSLADVDFVCDTAVGLFSTQLKRDVVLK